MKQKILFTISILFRFLLSIILGFFAGIVIIFIQDYYNYNNNNHIKISKTKKEVEYIEKNKKELTLSEKELISLSFDIFCKKNKNHNLCRDTSKLIEVKKYTNFEIFLIARIIQLEILKKYKYKERKMNETWHNLSIQYNKDNYCYGNSEEIILLISDLLIKDGVDPKKINLCYGYVLDENTQGFHAWIEIKKNNKGFYYIDMLSFSEDSYPHLISKDGRYIKFYSITPIEIRQNLKIF